MTHVAIIIVHYNTEEETRDCLHSLQKLKKDDFQVSTVVVDNGSKEVLSIAGKDLPDNTRIIRSDANLGFTNGNNLGLKYAQESFQPDYILLLNSDTTVAPDFLIQLLRCAKENERVGIVVPKIYFSPGREFHKESYKEEDQGKVLWYTGGSIDWANLDAFHRGVDELDRGQFDKPSETEFITGCCMLIPREVIDKVGLFEEEYFLYLEDVDLSRKIKQAGFRLLYCPSSQIWHKNAGSSGGSGSSLHQYYQTRNRLYFFAKYGTWKTRMTLMKFALRLLVKGSAIERRGVIDWFIGRMGKQPIL
jgi:GT2 family glycosyltransferase